MTDAPSTSTSFSASAPADAVAGNWVDRFAPAMAKPYLRLIRADRPVGVWLLWLPCLWGASLALLAGHGAWTDALRTAVLCGIGAFAMRGAGCAYNDIVDRDFDSKVARTALRPIPAGEISVRRAWTLVVGLSLVGLLVLLQFNAFTIGLGVASLGLVAAYPFMKRITWWPQAWLGLTFNWGALVGYAAAAGGLSWSAALLYAGGIAWTLGYDTIYAHQDKEDDALIGVKSSARALGDNTVPALAAFYGACLACLAGAGAMVGAPALFYAALAPVGAHFAWQATTFDFHDAARQLRLFKSNRDAGLLVLAAFLLAAAIAAV